MICGAHCNASHWFTVDCGSTFRPQKVMLKPISCAKSSLGFSTVTLKTKEKILQIKHSSSYLGFVLIILEYFFSQFCSKSAWNSNDSPSHYLCTSSTRDGLTPWPGPAHCWVLVRLPELSPPSTYWCFTTTLALVRRGYLGDEEEWVLEDTFCS